jgi:hypothetical protein
VPRAAAAQALVGVDSTSEVIDIPLDQLIRAERLRADIAAYRRVPPTEDEVELATFADASGLGDNTDWEALYDDDSVANLDNVQLLARDRFCKRFGTVQPATMSALCTALSIAVDCHVVSRVRP